MKELDYWRLCDELTIDQAAHLLIGVSPGSVEANEDCGFEMVADSRVSYITELSAATTAITSGLRLGEIKGKAIQSTTSEWDQIAEAYVDCLEPESIDPIQSRIEVRSLRNWLRSKGFCTGFFFPEEIDAADYLDSRHERYAPKLAAAVKAWQAVSAPSGKSPKQALLKWLREHAAEFGMTDDEGKVNETGVEEIAKVANWQLSGGAPKTPNE